MVLFDRDFGRLAIRDVSVLQFAIDVVDGGDRIFQFALERELRLLLPPFGEQGRGLRVNKLATDADGSKALV